MFNTFIVQYEKAEIKSSRKSIRMCLSDFPDIKDNQLEERRLVMNPGVA